MCGTLRPSVDVIDVFLEVLKERTSSDVIEASNAPSLGHQQRSFYVGFPTDFACLQSLCIGCLSVSGSFQANDSRCTPQLEDCFFEYSMRYSL